MIVAGLSGAVATYSYYKRKAHDGSVREYMHLKAIKGAQESLEKNKIINDAPWQGPTTITFGNKIKVKIPNYARTQKKVIAFKALAIEEYQKSHANEHKKEIWFAFLSVILTMGTVVATIAATAYLPGLGLNSQMVAGAASVVGVVGFAMATASLFYAYFSAFPLHIEEDENRRLIKVAKSVQDRF